MDTVRTLDTISHPLPAPVLVPWPPDHSLGNAEGSSHAGPNGSPRPRAPGGDLPGPRPGDKPLGHAPGCAPGEREAPQSFRGQRAWGAVQQLWGLTHLLGTVDGPLALGAVLSVCAAAALWAPVALPEAAHTSSAPGGVGAAQSGYHLGLPSLASRQAWHSRGSCSQGLDSTAVIEGEVSDRDGHILKHQGQGQCDVVWEGTVVAGQVMWVLPLQLLPWPPAPEAPHLCLEG